MNLNGIELEPGDTLLYATPDPVDWIIEVKTGSGVAHIEKYVGAVNGAESSVASRNGIGVGMYPVRTDGCVAILRPDGRGLLDIAEGLKWFSTVNHEGYDWQGLFNFFKAGDTVTPHALFCSAFAVEFDRACGFDGVHPQFPSNKVSPGDSFKMPGYDWLWVAKGVV